MKFFICSPVFPTDYKQYEILDKPSRKIIIFSPVDEWRAIAFANPLKIANVGYVKKIYLQPLVVG